MSTKAVILLLILFLFFIPACTRAAPPPAPTSAPAALIPPTGPTGTPAPRKTFPPTWTPIVPTPTPTQDKVPAANRCIPVDTGVSLGRVVKVLEGNTIQAVVDGKMVEVRYIGIRSPEFYHHIQRFGREARDKNREMVQDQVVTLVKGEGDKNKDGQLLRYVLIGDLFVNLEMVRQGYAAIETIPPDVACEAIFREAEGQAREAQAGIWSVPMVK